MERLREQRVNVSELSTAELSFYLANGFEVYKHWCYMELATPFGVEEHLPHPFQWWTAQGADVGKWTECHNEAFSDHWDHKQLTADSVRDFAKGGDGKALLGIVRTSRPVATSACQLRSSRGLGIIWSVGVLPSHRGLGLGKALVVKTISHLNALGARRIGLFVDEENVVAYGLYRKLGFKTLEKSLILRRLH